MYICANCNTKTEQWRPWLYERKKKNIRQEETAVEHEPVVSQELGMIHEADPIASPSDKSPQDNFVVFADADNSEGSGSETTAISFSKYVFDSDVEHHRWSHEADSLASPSGKSP